MPFSTTVVRELLVACHRRCCVCHRFCGVKMEIDHIEQHADGGPDDRDNAIPVCFECHAEIHLYNPHHPKGRRFTPEELRMHRDQWLDICRTRPDSLSDPPHVLYPGMMERLLNELDFNSQVANFMETRVISGYFETTQFTASLADGTLLMLDETMRAMVLRAYIEIRCANALCLRVTSLENPNQSATACNQARESVAAVAKAIRCVQEVLKSRLASDA